MQVSDRRYLSEGSMAVLNRPDPTEQVAQPAPMRHGHHTADHHG